MNISIQSTKTFFIPLGTLCVAQFLGVSCVSQRGSEVVEAYAQPQQQGFLYDGDYGVGAVYSPHDQAAPSRVYGQNALQGGAASNESAYPSYEQLPAPSAQAAPTPSAARTAASSGPRKHTVAKGDTLWRIGQRFGRSVQAIKDANGLSSDTIQPGVVLSIP